METDLNNKIIHIPGQQQRPQGHDDEGILLPRHILNDQKAQQELILSTANQAYQDAYQATMGEITRRVKGMARQLELGTQLMLSSVAATACLSA